MSDKNNKKDHSKEESADPVVAVIQSKDPELKKIPPQQIAQILQMGTRFYAGPTPPPEVLKAYEMLHPGIAGKMLEQSLYLQKEQLERRSKLEAKALSSDVCNTRLGLIFGFLIAVGILGTGVYAISMGGAASAATIIVGALASGVGAFVGKNYFSTKSDDKTTSK